MTLVNSLWSKSRGLTLQLTVAMKDGQNRAITLVSEPAEYIFTNGCGKEERRKHLHLHWSKRPYEGAHRTPLFVFAAWWALVIWLNDSWTKGIKSDSFKSDLMRTVEDVASCMASVTVFSTLDARSGFWQIKLDNECSLLAGRHLESSLLLLSFSVSLKIFLLGIPV